MRIKSDIHRLLGAVFVGFAFSGCLVFLTIGYSLIETEQRAREGFNIPYFHSSDLQSSPPVSQASIDKAVEIFKIRIPEGVAGPILDPSLTDRGLTLRKGVSGQIKVTIGPDAFSSWSLLGSTIAHETEVHCRQNFIAIHLLDLAGLDGTGDAEREAYSYELNQAPRFGLSAFDRDLIKSTSRYFYPKTSPSINEFPSLKFLVSKFSKIDTRKPVQPASSKSI